MKDTTTIPYKIYLSEDELPRNWYNVRADMTNKPAPLLNPGTLQPMTAEELGHVFCDELVKQELDDTTAYFDIPQEIQDFYNISRTTLIKWIRTENIPTIDVGRAKRVRKDVFDDVLRLKRNVEEDT